MVDEGTRKTLQCIPLLQTRASPRDKELWVQRLKEEYQALIKVICLKQYFNLILFEKYIVIQSLMFIFQYVQQNKTSDSDWFRLESNKEGQFQMETIFKIVFIHRIF